jgi:plastocyanin
VQTKLFNGIAVVFVALVIVTLGVNAYGSFFGDDKGSLAASSTLESGTVNALIKGVAFPDGVRTVAVGTKVIWTNEDGADHTVTAVDKSFDSATLTKGQLFERTFSSVGAYEYFCTIHPFMKGTITVVQPYGG